jgi:hypothetical protein
MYRYNTKAKIPLGNEQIPNKHRTRMKNRSLEGKMEGKRRK